MINSTIFCALLEQTAEPVFRGEKMYSYLVFFFFLKTFMNNGNAKHAVVFFDTMKQGYYGSRRQVYANDIKSIVT